MKKILNILVLLAPVFVFGQGSIGGGVFSTNSGAALPSVPAAEILGTEIFYMADSTITANQLYSYLNDSIGVSSVSYNGANLTITRKDGSTVSTALANVVSGSGAPVGAPGTGQRWYIDTTNDVMYFADGVNWVLFDADNMPITDAGGYFAGANVEAALQEVGPEIQKLDLQGVRFQPPFAILKVTKDSFTIDQNFSLKHYAGVSPADTLYVNVAVGSSGDGQTWGTAYKGLDEAITAANSAGTATQIRIAGGWYFDQHSSNAVTPTVPIEMIGDTTQGGRDTVFLTTDLRDQVGSFSATSNYYSATLTTQPGQLYDRSIVDTYGDSLSALTLQTSIATVDANPGSWWWDSNTIYIRTTDSRAPDSDIVYAQDAYNFTLAKDSIKVYLKDLYFIGGGLSFGLNGGQKGNSGMYLENCITEGTGYALTGGKTDEVFIFNSRFSKSDTEDLLSYGDSSNVIEYNLHVYNASEQNTACTTCNASTSHGSDIIRIDGNYHHTYGPVIADVVGAYSHNYGVRADSSLTIAPAEARSFYFGADVDSLRAFYVLQGCSSNLRASNAESIVADGNNVYIENFTGSAANLEANGGLILDLRKSYLPSANVSTTTPFEVDQNYVPKSTGTKFTESDIYNLPGAVGIHNTSPTAPLHVKRGPTSPVGAQIIIEDTDQEAVLALKTSPTRFGGIRFSDGVDRGNIRYGLSANTTFRKQFRFFPNTTVGPFVSIDSLARIGINAVPSSSSHLTILHSGTAVGTPHADATVVVARNSDDLVIDWRSNSIRKIRHWFSDQSTTAKGGIEYNLLTNEFNVYASSAVRFSLLGTGAIRYNNYTSSSAFPGATSHFVTQNNLGQLLTKDAATFRTELGVGTIANGGTGLSALGTANQLLRVNAGATALEYFTPSYLNSETNLFTPGGLTNTAFVTHTDNFGFEITGTGAKRLYTTNGTYNNSLIINSTAAVVTGNDGTNTANLNALANGNLVLNSSTGNYLIDTAPDTDTDAAGNVLLRNGSGFVNQVNRAAFEVLTGTGAPVNGTTTAYEVGQLYIDVATTSKPVMYYAFQKSTDPDAAATGSAWEKIRKDTAYITVTPISKSTTITATGELEGDYFVIDNTLAGWELDAITYAVTGNTATSGTMQMGIRRYTAANSFSSVSGLATFTTSDVRKTANVGITVADGEYYILGVNSYSFDVSPTGMTATIRFVK